MSGSTRKNAVKAYCERLARRGVGHFQALGVAAVVKPNECVVVTANEKDFRGAEVFNPLRAN